jgi:predicted enzyme related to lactoylglutathione lyase
MTADRLTLTLLATSDLARSVAFYEAVFGWKRTVDFPVIVQFELPGGMSLGLYAASGFGANTGTMPSLPGPGSISGTELYFHPADLDATIDKMKAAGGRLLSELAPRDWGDEAAYFADPDGNVVVLARPLSGR